MMTRDELAPLLIGRYVDIVSVRDENGTNIGMSGLVTEVKQVFWEEPADDGTNSMCCVFMDYGMSVLVDEESEIHVYPKSVQTAKDRAVYGMGKVLTKR